MNDNKSEIILKSLTTEPERQELKIVSQEDTYFHDLVNNYDEILFTLNVISTIKGEKIFTKNGIRIPVDDPQPYNFWTYVWKQFPVISIQRYMFEENRFSNLRAIRAAFTCALLYVDGLLQEREQLYQKPREHWDRNDVSCFIRNEQCIESLLKAMSTAIDGVSNLKQTYVGDRNMCARIDTMMKILSDRKQLVQKNIEFLQEPEQQHDQ
jgi:hypothetical protein